MLIPLLINELGDEEFGKGAGKIMWSYVSVVMAVITAILYMSVTALIEFGHNKRIFLMTCGRGAALLLILFIFAFTPGSVYLAAILVVCSVCSHRIAGVAYDSLLDAIALGKDAHQISSRGQATGYLAMIAFLCSIAPILGIIYVAAKPNTIWLFYLLPTCLAGLWYLLFLIIVAKRLPPQVYTGQPLPDNLRGNWVYMAVVGGYAGFIEQLLTIKSLYYFPDLALYIIGTALIADGGAAATSAAVIIASDVIGLSFIYIGAGAVLGLSSAAVGLIFFKWIHVAGYLTPKQIVILNVIILCLLAVYALYITDLSGVMILCFAAGTQVGSFGAFSRSIISRIIPTQRQSRFFSLYTFSQKGTSWLAPLVIGALTQTFGDSSYVRVVVLVSLAELVLGLPFVLAVNIARAEETRELIDIQEKQSLCLSSLPVTHPLQEYKETEEDKERRKEDQ